MSDNNKRQIKTATHQLRPLAIELLDPVSFALFSVACWGLLAALGVAGNFPFEGLLAHWMIWVAAATGTRMMAGVLRGHGEV